MQRLRLKDIADVKRLIGRTARMLFNGEINEDRARTIATLCNSFVRAYEVGKIEDIEKRLSQIENEFNES